MSEFKLVCDGCGGEKEYNSSTKYQYTCECGGSLEKVGVEAQQEKTFTAKQFSGNGGLPEEADSVVVAREDKIDEDGKHKGEFKLHCYHYHEWVVKWVDPEEELPYQCPLCNPDKDGHPKIVEAHSLRRSEDDFVNFLEFHLLIRGEL